MNTATVYALLSNRDKSTVECVLDHFSPKRIPCTAEYEYPQYSSDPLFVAKSDFAILKALEEQCCEAYSIYWSGGDGCWESSVIQAIAIYTDDGSVIFGLVVPWHLATTALRELQNCFGVQWGVITGDEFPPDSRSSFIWLCEHAKNARVLNGKLIE